MQCGVYSSTANNAVLKLHLLETANALVFQFQRTLNQKELKDTLQKNLPSLRGRARDGMALYKRMTVSRMTRAESIRLPTKKTVEDTVRLSSFRCSINI